MEVEIIKEDKKFKFKCKKCGFCCDNTIIQLYPFDIYNICKTLNLTTQELHKSNFTKFLLDENQIPRCILNNKPNCKFKVNNLCEIYEDRPLRCKLFPIGRYFEKDKIEYILPKQKCQGFDTGQKQTVSEFLSEQEVSKFDNLAKQWNNFIIEWKDNQKTQMFPIFFRKIFYDFDDKIIKSYREKLNPENNEEDLMKNLYEIAETLLQNSFDPSNSSS